MKNGIKIMLCAAFLLLAVGGLMIGAAAVKGILILLTGKDCLMK